MSSLDNKELAYKCVVDFKKRYPDLNVANLKATLPETLKNNGRWPKDLENNEIYKILMQLNLNIVTLSVIFGTVFGDTSIGISRNYANARMNYKHSTRQTDWFMWKTLCPLAEFTNVTGIILENLSGFQLFTDVQPDEKVGKWVIATKATKKLTILNNIIAPNGVKVIDSSWLIYMTNYFLMTLWLDDGSLNVEKGRQGLISVGKRPMEEAKILADYITNGFAYLGCRM